MSFWSNTNGYNFDYVIENFFRICDGLYGSNNPYRFPNEEAYENAIKQWNISLITLPQSQIMNCEEFSKWFYRLEIFSHRPPTFYEFSHCDDFISDES